MVKTVAPQMLHDITLTEGAVRNTHGVTIAAYRGAKGSWQNAEADTVLHDGDLVLVVGPTTDVERFAQLR